MGNDVGPGPIQPGEQIQRSPREDAAAALLDGELAAGVWDREGDEFVPVWVNNAFGELTGYDLDQARDLGESLLGPGYRTVLVGLLDAARSGTDPGGPVFAALPVRTSLGQHLEVPVAITLRRNESGKVRRLIITQRRSASRADDSLSDFHSRQGLEVVARISEILADFDEPKALDAIARLIHRQLNAWCGFVVDDGVLHLTGDINEHVRVRPATVRGLTHSDGADPVAQMFSRATQRAIEVDLNHTYPAGSHAAQLVDLVREQVGQDPAAPMLQALPLAGRGRTLGLMVVLPEDYDGDHHERATVLELCARRVGMALENAQLHQGEHALVETLQRAMLPELDQIESLDVWTYYAPSAEHAQVGGDWYDVVRLSDQVNAVVIGDVAGHDIEAAAAMGQLRSVVRAFAADLHEPAQVLNRVDRIVDSMRIGRVASLIYSTLRQREAEGTWELNYTRAGHLPGLLLRDGEVSELDGAGGRLVGFGAVERTSATEELRPGDVVVLYTDGLVERRDRPIQRGLEVLREALATANSQDAASVGEFLVGALAEAPEDDVAVVVVRVPEPWSESSNGRSRRWRFPAAKESVRLARRAAVVTCRTWGIGGVNAVELVVSELVANAVMHAWGTLTLTLVDAGDAVRVEVEDDNPMPPAPAEAHPARVGGYGMHIVARLADWGWRPYGAGKVVWARIDGNSPDL